MEIHGNQPTILIALEQVDKPSNHKINKRHKQTLIDHWARKLLLSQRWLNSKEQASLELALQEVILEAVPTETQQPLVLLQTI
jgi:hypothetical protein